MGFWESLLALRIEEIWNAIAFIWTQVRCLIPRPPIDIDELSSADRDTFVGRQEELKMLDKAYDDDGVHFLVLEAAGGMGKTALAAHWLKSIKEDPKRRPRNLIAWSFYNQGSAGDATGSANLFINRAVRLAHVKIEENESAYEKGQHLANALLRQSSLIILDGLESLQIQQPSDYGALRDEGIRGFLRNIQFKNRKFRLFRRRALCLITTRIAVEHLAEFGSVIATHHSLDRLDNETGATLLERLGVNGSRADLKQLSDYYQGHPLFLLLLANYICVVYDGQVAKYLTGPPIIVISQDDTVSECVCDMLDSYCTPLQKRRPLALAILYALALFDRPVGENELLVLNQIISTLAGQCAGVHCDNVKLSLNYLVKMKLVARETRPSGYTVDCHPVIRSYLAGRFKSRYPSVWMNAHRELFTFYCQAAPRPADTYREIEPLYRAVRHGCESGMHREVLHGVFIDRIRRGSEHYSFFRLGAVDDDIRALGWFFDERWRSPSRELNEADRAYVLNEVASAFRVLARPSEGISPAQRAYELRKTSDDDTLAASARNLSKLLVEAGRLSDAWKYSLEAVTLTRGRGDAQEYISLANHGRVLHLLGRLVEAKELFREAIVARSQFGQTKFTLQETHYCELLLDLADIEAASRLLTSSPQPPETENDLLDCGLYHYSKAKITGLGGGPKALRPPRSLRHFNPAIQYLRRSHRRDELGFAYVARSVLHRSLRNWSLAVDDLNSALAIACPSDHKNEVIPLSTGEPTAVRISTDAGLELPLLYIEWSLSLCDLCRVMHRPDDKVKSVLRHAEHLYRQTKYGRVARRLDDVLRQWNGSD